MKLMNGDKVLFEATMSWDKPIEQEILEYVQKMRQGMEKLVEKHDSKSIKGSAEYYASAYRTVEAYIKKEIEFRRRWK